MKELVFPITNGGVPLFTEDVIDVVQGNYFDIFRGKYTSLRKNAKEGVVISGVTVTATAAFDTTEGIVFLDGEFYTLPAQTNIADPSYIIPDTDVTTQRIFKDLTLNDVFVTRTATITGAVPGSGQYITINRASPHDGWLRYTTYYALANTWTESATIPLEFRKNDDGTVSFRGTLIYNSATVTSDLFISNLSPPVPFDITPGDETPIGGLGAAHIGIAFVSSGAFTGIQPCQALGSFSAGILQISVPGILAGDVSATNRSVRIDLTYGTQDFGL